ncbi:MAG: single-stranded-DNA-specific exonuclease RecJ [Clostridia bacterium]|nr:single-stranded-DNA-specific exonuclease RecJ [Clostridia bacterium]
MKEMKRKKVWKEKYAFGEEDHDKAVRAIASKLGVSEWFAVLLYNRGYHTPEEAERFLKLEQENFHDPYLLADMDRAVERIFRAVEDHEKIYIYGDYDVDGVTSVTALYLYLRELGCDVGIKIPKREGEGYGVSCAAIDALASEGTTLIITVDTGITANDEVLYAKELGVDFVITDHHECRTELPQACAVVNPHRPDCPYPFKELAGVGVVFKLLCACEIKRCRDMERPIIDGIRRVCMNYADLTAIGTIADVMPVIDENRMIISLGLKLMENTSRQGLRALIEASSRRGSDDTPKKITSGLIGFGVAPRINAAGRIGDATVAVRLLLEEDEERAQIAAEELCEINRHRQAEENEISIEAYQKIENSFDPENDLVIVLDSNHWHQGIIGIVASRITEKYGLPSILISFDPLTEEDHPLDDGKGSGRSIKGMNLVEALNYCDDLLLKYGGHELAAGLTIKRANLEKFRQKINEYAKNHLNEDIFRICIDADCAIRMKNVTMQLAKELLLLEPFGTGNLAPIFMMRDVTVKKMTSIGSGKHTRLLLEQDGVCMTALYFGVALEELGFTLGDVIDVLFHIDINDYKNVQSVQMILQDARIAERYSDELDRQKNRYAEVHSGALFSVAEEILPERSDFARVYKTLRHESRAGICFLNVRDMLRLINAVPGEEPMNYVKLKYILRVFHELQLCEVEEIQPDVYQFRIFFNASKTNIEKSSILKKLKSQCADLH